MAKTMEFTYKSTVWNTIENVWEFVMDFERRPEWITFYDKSYISDRKEEWVGTKYKDKLTFLGIPLYIEYTITHYEENKEWRSNCKMPPFYPKLKAGISKNGDGSIDCYLTFEITLKGPFVFIPKSLIRKQVDELVEPCIQNYIDIISQPESKPV